MIENKKIEYENTVIIGVINKNQSESVVKDYLDELTFLSETAGGVVKKRFIQKLKVQIQKHLLVLEKYLKFKYIIRKMISVQ